MDSVQPLAAIVLVMAVMGGVLLFLRRRGQGVLASRTLEVVERVSLGPQHALHLVRAGDRMLLVATAPGSCQLLDHGADREGKE